MIASDMRVIAAIIYTIDELFFSKCSFPVLVITNRLYKGIKFENILIITAIGKIIKVV